MDSYEEAVARADRDHSDKILEDDLTIEYKLDKGIDLDSERADGTDEIGQSAREKSSASSVDPINSETASVERKKYLEAENADDDDDNS